tara:strand:+ start:8408 stop:8602 length:195 start_codon:yes stop_codon:yes gene_type:complete
MKFIITKTKKRHFWLIRKWYIRLVFSNGRTAMHSQGYSRKVDAYSAVTRIQNEAALAEVLEETE